VHSGRTYGGGFDEYRAITRDVRPTANPVQFVIPVRYVAQGEVVHASTTALSADDVHVRSVLSPQPGLSIA